MLSWELSILLGHNRIQNIKGSAKAMLGYAREIRKKVRKQVKQIPFAKVCINAECFIGLII